MVMVVDASDFGFKFELRIESVDENCSSEPSVRLPLSLLSWTLVEKSRTMVDVLSTT